MVISALTYMNGYVYFAKNDSELWRSDGTIAGTTLVKSFNLPINNIPFMAFNNKLYFRVDDIFGAELWSSDGTLAGTTLLKDIRVGSNGSYPENLTSTASTTFNKFYFTADDGTHGRELWVSDGTAAGTILINIHFEPPISAPLSSNPQSLTFVGNLLLFSAYTNNSLQGRELWRSGGTVANTTLVKDINIATNVSGISNQTYTPFPVISQYIYFPAISNNSIGIELWKSNGIAAGTTMVNDLFQGNYNDGVAPNAAMHVSNTGRVFFEATDGQNGRELWSFPFCPTTQIINTTVQTSTQKQQASTSLNSTSNIANTDFIYGDLDVLYTGGGLIQLSPGFQAISKQAYPNVLPTSYRQTVFKAQIGGCN